MRHNRLAVIFVIGSACAVSIPTSPAVAATTSCKSVTKGGSGSAKKIRATSMSCTNARKVAKGYIGSFSHPEAYTCSYKQRGFADGQLQYDVRCSRKKGSGRLTFRMSTSSLPPAGPALPNG